MIQSYQCLKTFRARILSVLASLGGAFLLGCLGGELDSSTVAPVRKDSTVVILPPKDSTPVHDTVPTSAVHSLYPRLNTGDKWDFAQHSGTDTGRTISYEVVGDSVFGSDSVYIERYSIEIPVFVSTDGYLVTDYRQTERLYLRKSDQETLHESVTRSMQAVAPGDSLPKPYRMESDYITVWSGVLPDTLMNGTAWKLRATQQMKSDRYYPDTVFHEESSQSWTRSYRIKSSPPVTVKAGTFPVYEVDLSDSGSTYVYQVLFSPEAKFMVREIDIDTTDSYADTTELTHLLLK